MLVVRIIVFLASVIENHHHKNHDLFPVVIICSHGHDFMA